VAGVSIGPSFCLLARVGSRGGESRFLVSAAVLVVADRSWSSEHISGVVAKDLGSAEEHKVELGYAAVLLIALLGIGYGLVSGIPDPWPKRLPGSKCRWTIPRRLR